MYSSFVNDQHVPERSNVEGTLHGINEFID